MSVPLWGSTTSQSPTSDSEDRPQQPQHDRPDRVGGESTGDQEGADDHQDPADEDRRPHRGDGRNDDCDAADEDRQHPDCHQAPPAAGQPVANLGVQRHSSRLHARDPMQASGRGQPAAALSAPSSPFLRPGCLSLDLPLVPANPLAHRVVGDPVFPTDGQVTRPLNLVQQLLVWGPLDLARVRPRYATCP